uniref:Uncharacterized protein n=1 Tax=Arundo donax TaxID=35708 RepID=A0A0A9BXE4_ARUDO
MLYFIFIRVVKIVIFPIVIFQEPTITLVTILCYFQVMQFKLFSYPGRVVWLKPYCFTGVLELEIRVIEVRFGLSVVPPFVRVRKEDLPQAKPVYVLVLF